MARHVLRVFARVTSWVQAGAQQRHAAYAPARRGLLRVPFLDPRKYGRP
jgi:hypothetical protein